MRLIGDEKSSRLNCFAKCGLYPLQTSPTHFHNKVFIFKLDLSPITVDPYTFAEYSTQPYYSWYGRLKFGMTTPTLKRPAHKHSTMSPWLWSHGRTSNLRSSYGQIFELRCLTYTATEKSKTISGLISFRKPYNNSAQPWTVISMAVCNWKCWLWML